jgi:membrane protease YdiL (CAAX protease family)
MHPLAASAVLGLVWGVWHLPNFWIPGSSQAFIPIPVYLLYVFGHTFLYSWIYNGSRGSLLLVCLHHAATNAFTVALAALPTFAALIAHPATLLLSIAIAVSVMILRTRATLLAECARQADSLTS